jgi:hypothetical protein
MRERRQKKPETGRQHREDRRKPKGNDHTPPLCKAIKRKGEKP